MLALSVLDAIVSMDHQHIWLNFLCGHGYLQHLVDSLATEDDDQLLATLLPQPGSLRALYIFQSKMVNMLHCFTLVAVKFSLFGIRILYYPGWCIHFVLSWQAKKGTRNKKKREKTYNKRSNTQ